ncbi:MAG: DUF2652 domain-containing protein [Alphaproteobacteria bacterium]
MAESGFLVVADISGYTRFLTGSELEHAQGVLEDLLSVILERLKSPLQLSNIQGDAILAYSRDDEVWSSGHVVDSVEALYFGFRDRLKSIVYNTTCPCRACVNAKKLDLKFVVHHGEFVVQNVAGPQELTGSDVILLHRLLKNDVPKQTGIGSYILFTSAAADALGLAELKDGADRYVVELAEFGRIEGVVIDLGARWEAYHKTNEIVVRDGELWFEPVSGILPYNIESVWEAYCNPAIKSRWNTIFNGFKRTIGDPQRVTIGAVDHCEQPRHQTLPSARLDLKRFGRDRLSSWRQALNGSKSSCGWHLVARQQRLSPSTPPVIEQWSIRWSCLPLPRQSASGLTMREARQRRARRPNWPANPLGSMASYR